MSSLQYLYYFVIEVRTVCIIAVFEKVELLYFQVTSGDPSLLLGHCSYLFTHVSYNHKLIGRSTLPNNIINLYTFQF